MLVFEGCRCVSAFENGVTDVAGADHWETLNPGDVVDAQDGMRHAWRNSSPSTATMLCVTTMQMTRFLRDISADDGSADPLARGQRFLQLVQQHGYWLASSQENAAIGLDVSWGDEGKLAPE